MKKLIAMSAIIFFLVFLGCSAAESDNGTEERVEGENIIEDVTDDNSQQDGKQDNNQPDEPEAGQGNEPAAETGQTELVLSFVGDVMFDRSVAAFIKAKGEDYPFQGYEKYFMDSDIVFANLETAIGRNGEPMEDKQYTFRSSPRIAPFLKKYNFTVLSIANNHIMDYGRPAFLETLKILRENGINYGGGGYNRQEALEGIVIENKGIKIGFIAFTGIVPHVDWYAGAKRSGIIGAYKVHEPEVLAAVEKLRQKCDLLVVSLHWGKERETTVRKQESELAHKLVDAGADIVVGHHPHVVQGAELYKDKLILYSLGNFIFTTSYSEISNKTLMVMVRFDQSCRIKSIEAIPGIIKEGRPVPMEGLQGREFLDYINKMNINIHFQY